MKKETNLKLDETLEYSLNRSYDKKVIAILIVVVVSLLVLGLYLVELGIAARINTNCYPPNAHLNKVCLAYAQYYPLQINDLKNN
jgi:hypothetical protein